MSEGTILEPNFAQPSLQAHRPLLVQNNRGCVGQGYGQVALGLEGNPAAQVVTLRLFAGFETPATVVACPVYVVVPRSGTWLPQAVKADAAGSLAAGSPCVGDQKKKKGFRPLVKTCP